MIKAIFFDLYNTLVHFQPSREELQQAACGEFGIQVTPEGITQGYSIADDFFSRENARASLFKRPQEEQGEFFGEYQRLILKGAGVEVSRELALKVFTRMRQIDRKMELFDDVLPTLEALKRRDLTLGLISNIYRDVEHLCQELGISPYLKFLLTSKDVVLEKPHPPIFLAALERAGVEPREAIHVGDQYNSDVVGARGVGINPLLLDRDGLLKEINDCPKIQSLTEVEKHL